MRIGPHANPVFAASEGWRRERGFYAAMAVVAALTTFVGFAPTYYLKAAHDTPALPPLVHLHGAVFTAWIILLAAQVSLVAAIGPISTGASVLQASVSPD